MKKISTEEPRQTVGLDVGDRYTFFCLLDQASGEVVEEGRVRTTREALGSRFGHQERMRIVLEVGPHSPWISRLLRDLGHEVIVANARRLALIYGNARKQDRVDAEGLARLGRFDPKLLSAIVHSSEAVQVDRAVLHSRDVLVRSRAQLINHVRGVAKAMGHPLPKCSAPCFAKRVVAEIPSALEPALVPVIEQIATLTERIRTYDREIEAMAAERYPESQLLVQVGGVGVLTALAFVLKLGSPARLRRNRMVGPYLGLVPRRDQSGARDPQLRITKTGDAYVRRLLVGSAHYILGPFGPDCDLRRYGEKIAERGGKNAKKRAVVAVARKLAVLLLHLWRNGEVYDPFFSQRARKRQVA
jgi:transposase